MLKIYPEILEKTPGFRLGYLELTGVIVREPQESFWDDFNTDIDSVRTKFSGRQLTDDPVILGIRKLFRAWKMDPTRYRPSSERLNRRILKKEKLFRINTAVDVCNRVSLNSRMPFGLYDRDKTAGGMVLRYGVEGEKYAGITGQELNAANRVVVCDDSGPIGSPVTDSAKTAVDLNTTSLILLVYSPEGTDNNAINGVMTEYQNMIAGLQDMPVNVKIYITVQSE